MNRYDRIIELYAKRRNFASVGDYYIHLRNMPADELELEIKDVCKFDFDRRMDEGIDMTDPDEVEQSVNMEKTFKRHLKNIRREDDVPMEKKEPELVERELEDLDPVPKQEFEPVDLNVESEKERLYNEEAPNLDKEVESITNQTLCSHDWLFIKEDEQFKYVVCKKCLKIEAHGKGEII
jgi:hypothetical protein